MTQEALKLAIQLQDTASGYWTENEITIIEQLIEALAQTQEPAATVESVATVVSESGNQEVTMSWWHEPALPVGTKLYTTPPQRTWVGLTDEEMTHTNHHMVEGAYQYSFKQGALWAEAKLKEKNT